MRIAVILSGSGVYDGAEIQESVFTLLALDERGAEYQVFAPDKNQYHVINHLTGEEMPEIRNVLVESARIARGNAKDLKEYEAAGFNGLVIPGGFGAAKNLNQWALKGPDGEIDADVKRAILETVEANKPIVGLCMGPTVIAKALEGSKYHAELTVGTTEEKSPYEIAEISAGLKKTGAKPVMKTIREVNVDSALKIITAPCYMMEGSISDVKKNIDAAIDALLKLA
jgi:enhancing lycopene biosynthesis protein 2